MFYPLDGLVVISLAEQYPGPYATLLMADLGAEVWLVERPGSGDPARQWPGFFSALNRNKKSVALDLKASDGHDGFLELVKKADVLLEGFRPGAMEKLGLGYDKLKAVNSRLIYASISGFGQNGPYRDRPAHDLSYQALAGLLFKHAKQPAPPPEIALGDLSAGLFAAVGVLSALHARAHSGKGCFVDVSMTDGLVSMMTVFLAPLLNKQPSFNMSEVPAYGNFSCADGKVLSLSIVHEDHFWKVLCITIGMGTFADFRHGHRSAESASLRAKIAETIRTKNRDAWGRLFDTAGIPWSPVYDLDEVLQDPHFKARGLFGKIEHSPGESESFVAQPLSFNGQRPTPRHRTPRLGEHTDELGS